MLLSIGMIVKNEEKYLDRCLSALSPILQEIPSEIIIVDTGSTDSTVEIAKKYTDKIYYFKWCDDFAAARNISIKNSTGKWYMYVDADEIIKSTEEIISFFKSNEYQKYYCANLVIRNLSDEADTAYSDFQAFRLYVLNNNTRFTGKIHEYIPYSKPVKIFSNTILDHYGYAFKGNEELAIVKSQRNITLLLNELKSHKNDIRIYQQICESYLITGKNDEAIEYALQGLEIAKRTNSNQIYALYSNLANIYTNTQNDEKAFELINEYFTSKYCNVGTDVDLYYNMMLIYNRNNEYQKCINTFTKYNNCYTKHFIDKKVTEDMLLHSIMYSTDIYFNNAKLIAAMAYIKLYDFANAYNLIKAIGFDKIVKTNFIIEQKIQIEFAIINQTHNTNRINELLEESYSLEDKNISVIINSYIIYYLIKYNISLEYIVDKIDFSYITDIIMILNSSYKEFINTFTDVEYIATNNLKVNFLLASIYEQLLNYIDERNKDLVYIIFEKYTQYLSNHISLMYNVEYLKEENLCIYPKAIVYGYYCIQAIKCLQAEKYKECIQILKLALNENPGVNQIISYLVQYIDNIIKSKHPLTEFDELSITIKNNIRALINSNQFDMAKNILEEYKSINPYDTDIIKLEEQIYN